MHYSNSSRKLVQGLWLSVAQQNEKKAGEWRARKQKCIVAWFSISCYTNKHIIHKEALVTLLCKKMKCLEINNFLVFRFSSLHHRFGSTQVLQQSCSFSLLLTHLLLENISAKSITVTNFGLRDRLHFMVLCTMLHVCIIGSCFVHI